MSFSVLSRIHSPSRRSSFTSKRMDSRNYENWACIGSHNQFSTLQIWNWNLNLVRESRQFSILGQKFLMERSYMWSIQIKTIQKFLRIHNKSKYNKQASRLLHPDQRQKQNHNRENLLVQQQPYRCTKKDGLTLSHQNKILRRTIFRRSDQSSSTRSNSTARKRWSN